LDECWDHTFEQVTTALYPSSATSLHFILSYIITAGERVSLKYPKMLSPPITSSFPERGFYKEQFKVVCYLKHIASWAMRLMVATCKRTPSSSRVSTVTIYFAFLTSWTGADGEISFLQFDGCSGYAPSDPYNSELTQPLQLIFNMKCWEELIPSPFLQILHYIINYKLMITVFINIFLRVIYTGTDPSYIKSVSYNPRVSHCYMFITFNT
jgi:hypothetical protein